MGEIRTLSDEAQVGIGVTQPQLVPRVLINLRLVGQGNQAALVVGSRALVIDGHETITLEVGNWYKRCVDWELAVVYAETMTMGVGVREETGLEDGVSGWLDTRYEVRW